MRWRPIGSTAGEPYPAWVRALKGKSGVYAIRHVGLATRVLYVGESHTGNLYGTLTRHFQRWSRWKKPPKTVADWWIKTRAWLDGPEVQTDPGHAYERTASIEVAVKVATAARAVALQSEWIRSLKPRDNVALVDEDAAPF